LLQFRLAHLSDLHLPMEGMFLGLSDYFSKRLFSHISWRSKRHLIHRPEVLAQIAADIRSHLPDHIAVTGDICNLSLRDEFAAARQWLQDMGDPFSLTVVAGNHDALIASPDIEQGFASWQPWMSGDEDKSPIPSFPFLRRRGQIALIGVNTAVPTPPFKATGRVGKEQMLALKEMLKTLGEKQLCRILLIHHPLNDEAEENRKHLSDRAELRAMLKDAGAELVLHGHTHETGYREIAGPNGSIPVIGVPSASNIAQTPVRRAGWNLVTISRQTDAWQIDIRARRLKEGHMEDQEQRSYRQAIAG